MPGARSTYTARTADYHVQYSDEHPWCGLDVFLPDGDAIAAWIYNRGGGNISEPNRWDRWGYDPDAGAGESAAFIEAMLDANIAYIRAEYPNGPQPIFTSRHHPTVREPHNWMFMQRAVQFMQTHALDGRITGSRGRTLPVDYRGYFMAGPSAGALNAAMVALAPRGHVPYDSLFRRNFGPFAVEADGRIKGAWCDDLPAEFMTYGDDLSANTLPFIGDSGRVLGDDAGNKAIVNATRLSRVRRENLRDIGPLKLVELDANENTYVSLLINTSGSSNLEASYFGSGLTFAVSASTGSFAGATSISVAATPSVTATVKKIVDLGGGVLRVYAEPGASVFLAQWVGNLTLGSATITAYTVAGNDTRKTFLTRAQSTEVLKAADYGPFQDLVTPHHVAGAGAVASAREALFAARGIANPDVYYLGSEYPAEISGDAPCTFYDSTHDRAQAALDWMANNGVEID
jgi:hypothetical protein